MTTTQPSICIVGAGAAGLSAAWYLAKARYTDVTVYEREDRVGGKCWSVPIPPSNRVVEMGAVEITPAYPNVLEIVHELGIEMQPEPKRGTADLAKGTIVWNTNALWGEYSKAEVALAALAYLGYVSVIYAEYADAPGMAGPIGPNGKPTGIPKDLCVPMAQWLSEHGLDPLSGLFQYAATIYGYGDMSHTPAAYMLRYFDSKNFGMVLVNGIDSLLHVEAHWPKNLTNGYQDIWTRVATKLGVVQLGTQIAGIERGDKITIHFADSGTSRTFDKLIVTCCLDKTLPNLISDLSPEEKELFALTRYSDYYTTAVTVESFPDKVRAGSFGEVPLPPKGHPWGVFKVWEDVDAAVYYSVADSSIDGDAVYKLIQEDASELGYTVGPIIEVNGVKLQKQWNYFPHVDSSGISQHYLALEALQGQKNTFYSGGLLCFETVHNVVTYSKSVITRNFLNLSTAEASFAVTC